MSTMPNGTEWTIREQIYRDPDSGLTLQFEILKTGRRSVRIFHDALPNGAHEVIFDLAGEWASSTVYMQRRPQPGWVRGAVAIEEEERGASGPALGVEGEPSS